MAIAPIAPQGIHHLAIQCHDLIGMVRFYERVLRLPVVRRWPHDNHSQATDQAELGIHESPHRHGDRAVWLGIGTAVIALEQVDEAAEPPPWRSQEPGLHLLALQIFPWSRQLWRDHLALYEVPILYESQWTLYVRDPEGNRLGLSHFPDDESDRQRTKW